MTRPLLRAALNLVWLIWCGFCLLGPFAFTQPGVPGVVQAVCWALVIATVIVGMALPDLMEQSPKLHAFVLWLVGAR